MGFSAREWARALVGAVVIIAVCYPLLVFVLVAGQP